MNMSWASAMKKPIAQAAQDFFRPPVEQAKIDWQRLVVIDFETYFDADYTLSKLSTSEYIRDKRFKAQMMGIKVGNKKTRVIPHAKIKQVLREIDWSTHALLSHNTSFDGFILSHHYGVVPKVYYDTLSMARGLHSNDIGASLDEVAQFYGVGNKVPDVLDQTKGVRDLPLPLYKACADYCAVDVDLTFDIFKLMVPNFPASEFELVDMTCQMFCDPVLRVDIPRVEKELAREIKLREDLMLGIVDVTKYPEKELLKTKAERELQGKERQMLMVKRIIGSNEKYAALLRAEGVEPPVKISPAWIKKKPADRLDEDKWAFAFAKDDQAFLELPDKIDEIGRDLNLNKKKDVEILAARQKRLRDLVDCRIAVKSTTNITRAQRFLTAGADGMPLPVGYAYARAHTLRWGGNNKMNMQNLTRGGELRQSILAPPGHVICVVDSGQIEARVNGWLWGQDDLLEAFKNADADPDGKVFRDAYCLFASEIYGREITKADKMERFVGKVCVGPDTPVYTSRGLIPITDVKVTDLLWDGESWVKHDGLLDQGRKETLTYRGLCATADHEILTGRGWQEWSEVLTDPSLFRSALSLATLPLSDGIITPPEKASLGATAQFADAPVGSKQWSTPAALSLAEQLDVTPAQKSLLAQNATGSTKMLWKMMSTVLGSSTGYLQRLAAAGTQTMRRISTMAQEVFQLPKYGSQTVPISWYMREPSLVGISLSLKWTALTRIWGMPPETFDSYLNQTTPKTSGGSKILNNASEISKQITQTYDLANAGPNQRFTVLTDDGPVIVHNCVLGLGFQMGAAKLQATLAKGALGGPPVYFELEMCQKIVQTYRRKNFKIAAGWQICTRIIEDMAAGRTGSWGCLSWEAEKIWLPNGMCLQYPDLKQVRNEEKGWDEWTYRAKESRKKLYGGLLCENIVQCLARLIVASQMLLIRKTRRMVMITHDENVAIAKKAQAEKAFAEMMKAMKTPPAWCRDIPLNAEGGWSENYSK
jgi:hypothetical protein